jgi:hypothetical protein
MNAGRRTPAVDLFHNLEREEDRNVGSLDDRNGGARPRANSTEANEEIRRLRSPREHTPRASQHKNKEAAAVALTEPQPASGVQRATGANDTPRDEAERPAGDSAGKKRGARTAKTPDTSNHSGG